MRSGIGRGYNGAPVRTPFPLHKHGENQPHVVRPPLWNPSCSCSVRYRTSGPNQPSQPYAKDSRFNAGIAASSVARSKKSAGLS
jgi:hypothetical protein